MRILLVEDEPIIRFYLKITLSNINGEIIDVKSGDEAISLLKADDKFDLIITDIKMQGIDGFELIEEIHKMNIDIPIIVESAFLDDDPRMNKYKNSVKAFIGKPIDLNLLESIIKQIEVNHHH